MKELVQFLVQQLVNQPNAVEVKETRSDTTSVLELESRRNAQSLPQFPQFAAMWRYAANAGEFFRCGSRQ